MKTFWLATVMVTLLLTGCEKARLDEEVRRLCAKDGGIKVHETVRLAPDKFDKFGNPVIPSKEKSKLEDEFFYEHELQYLKKGNPEIWRSSSRIVRRKDGKVMGESIRYTRRGGDVPSPMHDSSFTCPEASSAQPNFEQSVFHKQQEK